MRQAFIVKQPRHAALRALNYEPAVEHLRRPRRGRISVPLRSLVSDLGSGYATVFARLDCDRNRGVELLSQSDMFATEPEGRVIRVDSMQRPERHLVKKWHVLIAGAGTLAPTELYGRAIIADERLAGKYVGQDTLRLEFADADGDQALFAYAYLASPTGLRALRSTSYGTKILRIRKDVLAELPVPPVDDVMRARVARLVRRAVENRELYGRELGAARAVIEGLPAMKEALAMCAERRARTVIWDGRLPTIVAWSYAAAGEALRYLRMRWDQRLRDALAEGGMFTGLRFARIPCDEPLGVPLLSQRDVFMIRRIPRRVRQPPFDASRLIADESQLLIACDGQFTEGALFGKIEDARCGIAGSAVTQHILRLVPTHSFKPWLLAFLSTKVGHRLLQSTAVGTSVPMMRHDLAADLPIPTPTVADGARVSSHVEAAISARRAADMAEAEAIRVIEEEVLPPWLA